MELTLSTTTTDPVVAGSYISIICVASVNKTLADIDVEFDIELISPEGVRASESGGNATLGNYQKRITYDNISAQNSGPFVCNATVQPSTRNDFITPDHKNQSIDFILGKMIFL
jgi:hypothetical protein